MMSINQIIDLVQRSNAPSDKSRTVPSANAGAVKPYDDEDGAVMRAIAEAARLYQEKGNKEYKPDETA